MRHRSGLAEGSPRIVICLVGKAGVCFRKPVLRAPVMAFIAAAAAIVLYRQLVGLVF